MSKALVTWVMSAICFTLFLMGGCSVDRKWENFVGHYGTEYDLATTPQAKIKAASGFVETVREHSVEFSDHSALVYKSAANHIDIYINGIDNLLLEWQKIAKLDPATPEYQMAMTRTDLNLAGTDKVSACWLNQNHILFTAPIGLPIFFGLLLTIVIAFVCWLCDDPY